MSNIFNVASDPADNELPNYLVDDYEAKLSMALSEPIFLFAPLSRDS